MFQYIGNGQVEQNGVAESHTAAQEDTQNNDFARNQADLAMMEAPDEDQIKNNPFILS
jgi:hypothetical protein